MVAESSNEKVDINRRVKCSGSYGTIKYVGKVVDHPGEWLGIDWDEPDRGKHNGTVNGVFYFETRHPRSGSFARRRKLDLGEPLADSIRKKYAPLDEDARKANEAELLEAGRSFNAPFVQLVGMAAIDDAVKDVGRLEVTDMHGGRVNSAGDAEELGRACPRLRELDVSRNLLGSWTEVLRLCAALDGLRWLKVSENRMAFEVEGFVEEVGSELADREYLISPQKTSIFHQDSSIPPQNCSIPSQNSSISPQNSSIPPQNSSISQQNFSIPYENSTIPHQIFPISQQNSSISLQNFSIPPQNSSIYHQNSSISSQNSSISQQNSSIPPQNFSIPPQNSSTSPQNSSVPYENSLIPSQISKIPHQNSSISHENSSIPPQNYLISHQNSSILPQNSSNSPQNSSNLPQNSSKFPQNSSLPQNSPISQQNSLNRPQNCPMFSQNSISHQNSLISNQKSSISHQNSSIVPQNSSISAQNSINLSQNSPMFPQNSIPLQNFSISHENSSISHQKSSISHLNSSISPRNSSIPPENSSNLPQNSSMFPQNSIPPQNSLVSRQNSPISQQNTSISHQNSSISNQNSSISQQNSEISSQNSISSRKTTASPQKNPLPPRTTPLLPQTTPLPLRIRPKRAFPNLKVLICSRNDLDWSKISLLLRFFPGLSELRAPYNEIDGIESGIEPADSRNLEIIDLEGNKLTDWRDVTRLSEAEKLETLNLDGVGLREVIFEECGRKTERFANLKTLILSNNDIREWRSVGELNKLKSLESLRLNGNPVLEGESPAMNMQIAVAMIANLKHYNGTAIRPDERRGAEYDYVKKYAAEYVASTADDASKRRFLLEHGRYSELVAKHGFPEPSELATRSNVIGGNLLDLRISFRGGSTSKRIPKNISVQKLRILCQKLLKLPKRPVLKCASGSGSEIVVDLDNDSKDIGYYSVSDGDTILVGF